MGFFIVVTGLLCAGYGSVLLFDKDLAWRSVVWQNRNAGVASVRTEQWNTSATVGGVVLIGVGIALLLVFLRFGLPSPKAAPTMTTLPLPPAAPHPGQVKVGVEGRTLTPQEQEELNAEFKGGAFQDANGKPVKPGR